MDRRYRSIALKRNGMTAMIRTASSIALLAALTLTALPALAQSKPVQPPVPEMSSPDAAGTEAMLRAWGEAYSRADDSEQDPSELATTRALNAKVAAALEQADAADAESTAAFEAAQDVYLRQSADAEAARLNHEAEVRASDAAQERYQRDMAVWRACNGGDRAACSAITPGY